MAGCAGQLCLLVAVAFVPQARSAPSKKLQNLRAEFAGRSKSGEGAYFRGASKILTKISKLEEGDELQKTLPTLGFACMADEDFKGCSYAFAAAAKGRSDLEAAGEGDASKPAIGLKRLGMFCKELKAGNLLDAMAWGRQAMVPLEKEFEKTDAWNMLQFRFYSENAKLFDKKDFPGLSINDKPPNAVSLYTPGLTPRTWHKGSWFPGAQALEDNFERIGIEMDAYLSNPERIAEMTSVGKTSCRQDALLVKKGDWRDIGLYKKGVQDRRLCWKYFPHTCNIIEQYLPEVASSPWGIVSISRLGPGSDTMKHTGNSNAILTAHLGIHTPKEAGMLVGKETRKPAWQRGKVTVFDDSFDHQVWHTGKKETSEPRVVMLIRFWHPDMTLPERLEKVLTSKMILPDWLRPHRMDLLNSTEAEVHWRRNSKQFRKGTGVK